jgi:hypothetical protein
MVVVVEVVSIEQVVVAQAYLTPVVDLVDMVVVDKVIMDHQIPLVVLVSTC